MPKIILTRGLPGSGKTTWALEQVLLDPSFKRVSKDDIRRMMDGGRSYSKADRFVVEAIRDAAIDNLLHDHYTVVVDETFSEASDMFRLMSRVLKKHLMGLDITIQDFKTPVEVCITRDAQREHTVGRAVIEAHAKMRESYVGLIEEEYGVPACCCLHKSVSFS